MPLPLPPRPCVRPQTDGRDSPPAKHRRDDEGRSNRGRDNQDRNNQDRNNKDRDKQDRDKKDRNKKLKALFGDKPPYRFVIAFAGILAMAFAAMVGAHFIFPAQNPVDTPNEPAGIGVPGGPVRLDPPTGSPSLPSPDTGGLAPATSQSPGQTATPTVTTSRPPVTSHPQAEADVVGTYTIRASWPTVFHGSVRLTNEAEKPQAWTVILELPNSQDKIHTAWIDGQPPPVWKQTGRRVEITGSEPLPAGASVEPVFEVGSANPAAVKCWVNGNPCAT